MAFPNREILRLGGVGHIESMDDVQQFSEWGKKLQKLRRGQQIKTFWTQCYSYLSSLQYLYLYLNLYII